MAGILPAGNPVGAVSNVAGGGVPQLPAAGAVPQLPVGGEGGPLNTVQNTLGSGGPVGAVGGVAQGLDLGSTAGGLLGGSGLSVAGIVGLGSDDENLVDLAPTEKKKVKAEKANNAAKNKRIRELEYQKLRDAKKAQGGSLTPEQRKRADQLMADQRRDDEQMKKYDEMLGPTDPEYLRQAEAGELSTSEVGPSKGLFYAYLVNGDTFQPTHLLTFPNASAAKTWYSSNAGSVEKASDQMYVYSGTAPQPSGRMGCMPINTVQPIIPLQRGDGFPICCKKGESSMSSAPSGQSAANGTSTAPAASNDTSQPAPAATPAQRPAQNGTAGAPNGTSAPAPTPKPAAPVQPAPPPRKRLTFEEAAQKHTNDAVANGDTRSRDVIYQEAMDDLKANCATQGDCNGKSGGAPVAKPLPAPVSSATAGAPVPAGVADKVPAANGLGGGALGGVLPGGGLNSLPVADGLLNGLGLGEGLNVANLVALGSDDPALVDLAPKEKKAARMERKRAIAKERDLQRLQAEKLKKDIDANGGTPTPEQEMARQELQRRRDATDKADADMDGYIAADEAQEKANPFGPPL